MPPFCFAAQSPSAQPPRNSAPQSVTLQPLAARTTSPPPQPQRPVRFHHAYRTTSLSVLPIAAAYRQSVTTVPSRPHSQNTKPLCPPPARLPLVDRHLITPFGHGRAEHKQPHSAETATAHPGRVGGPHLTICWLRARDDTSGNSCKAKLATKHRGGAGQGPTSARAGCAPNFSVRDKLDGRGALFLGADATKNLLAAACPDTRRNKQVLGLVVRPRALKSTHKRSGLSRRLGAWALRRHFELGRS